MGLYDELLPHRDQIADPSLLSGQTVEVNLKRWREKLGGTEVWKKTDHFLNETDRVFLRRQDLLGLVSGEAAPPEVRFMLVMLWGYGSGKLVGRGTKNVASMLSTPNFDTILAATHAALTKRDYETAFGELERLKGLSASYLTKVLYFETKGRGQGRHLLIFDDRVARSLFRFSLPTADRWLIDAISVGRGASWQEYELFMTKFVELAGRLDVPAENLEYWMFKANGKEVHA